MNEKQLNLPYTILCRACGEYKERVIYLTSNPKRIGGYMCDDCTGALITKKLDISMGCMVPHEICDKCEPEVFEPAVNELACAFCGHSPATHKVTRLTLKQKAENRAWSESFKDGFHTGHCPHLELPTYACQGCFDNHPESHLEVFEPEVVRLCGKCATYQPTEEKYNTDRDWVCDNCKQPEPEWPSLSETLETIKEYAHKLDKPIITGCQYGETAPRRISKEEIKEAFERGFSSAKDNFIFGDTADLSSLPLTNREIAGFDPKYVSNKTACKYLGVDWEAESEKVKKEFDATPIEIKTEKFVWGDEAVDIDYNDGWVGPSENKSFESKKDYWAVGEAFVWDTKDPEYTVLKSRTSLTGFTITDPTEKDIESRKNDCNNISELLTLLIEEKKRGA